jgi:predicted metal-dependent hydrolase
MITEDVTGQHSVPYGEHQIEFRVLFRKRKTLAITVHPDTSVTATVPLGRTVEEIKRRVRKRARWIRKQQAFFRDFLPPVPPRRYVSGETHRYLGRQYRLKVSESVTESVKLKGAYIQVEIRRTGDAERVQTLLEGWYRLRGHAVFERSLAACRSKLNGQLLVEPKLLLRHMPKRWGSCTKRGAIYLNPELIKTPSSCIDYVVTHELCHMVHPHHGKQFYVLLRQIMPDWEQRKARLENVLTG